MTPKHSDAGGKGRLSIALAALAITLLTIWQGTAITWQDLAFTGARTEVGFWGRGEYQPTDATIRRTGNTIATLTHSRPRHPEYLALQANFQAWQAYRAGDNESRELFRQLSLQSQYRALQARPAHRHSWKKMLEYASRTPGGEVLHGQAMEKLTALQLAPAVH